LFDKPGTTRISPCEIKYLFAVIYKKSQVNANRAGTGACPYSLTWALWITTYLFGINNIPK
jgi:hypothetical protein